MMVMVMAGVIVVMTAFVIVCVIVCASVCG
jgi:hypothetical protein